jgi:carboxypeptidase Taq
VTTSENLKLYYDRMSELHRLGCIASLLGWDQRVYMPPNGAQARADQLEYLSVTIHAKSTDPEFGRAVDDLAEVLDTLSPDDQVNIRESKRLLDIARKLPPDFVAEFAQTSTLAYSEWVKARPANDFKAVQALLEKLVELCRRRCDLVGYTEHPYDALLDEYEPGSKLSIVKPLLLALGEELRKIIPEISARYGCGAPLEGLYPTDVQAKLCRKVTENLGFSFDSGRIDTTAHPFMSTIGPRDFRITTRYDSTDFRGAFFGTIHETGHALYELGLPPEWVGTPRGEAVSLSVHESQSRLWENLVGRSREFSVYLSGVIREFFPEEADPQQLWRRANCVQPSLIRTEADEVTYSQHVVIRMLLEEQMITGDLTVTDLPDAWNELYNRYLGIRPTDYKNGVMQDVHWYSGAIGYFPTYALGNLYGAMMMEKARTEIADLPGKIERGEFVDLLAWLRENVHKHGMTYRGPQLIRNITGKDLTADAFVAYLKRKFLES